jgi:hypothetical protein
LALNLVEIFGYAPSDESAEAKVARKSLNCPFIQCECTKRFRDGTKSGVCTVKQTVDPSPIICCPNRLYAGDYGILKDVALEAFGNGVKLISGKQVAKVDHDGRYVAVFGKRWGKELRLPKRGGRGSYFVDWILALIADNGHLREFVALEVQAIDTTGNYRAERDAYVKGGQFQGSSAAGLNWENVSKRILPQIIYKGHVLRQERLCTKGLFFICPVPVYARIRERLGGTLRPYAPQPGALTFRSYDLGPEVSAGERRTLLAGDQLTTTIDQVALAFTAPSNLPEAGVYQNAIEAELRR